MKLPRTSRRGLLALLALSPLAARGAAAREVPRARAPVLLVRSRVNGEWYYDAAESLPTLSEGAALQLRREPTNPYDRRAIEVLDVSGRKLGYLARIDNPAVARMMDAGEQMHARVTRIDAVHRDIRVEVEWLRG